MERIGIGDVIDDNSDRGIPNVAWYEAPETLLAGGVPQLKANRPVLQVHGLGEEIDTDRGLVGVVETVIHEPGDERGLANRLLPKEDQLEFPQRIGKFIRSRHFRLILKDAQLDLSLNVININYYCE